MYLKSLELLQFKNHEKTRMDFSTQINCFTGLNGSGKTNILDGIHYLSLTKSAVQSSDTLNVKHNKDFFVIKGQFELDQKPLEVRCTFELGKKKQIWQNGKALDKTSEHVGLIPLVLIAPDDTELIKGGSEGRRKFFDGLLSQLDRNYLNQLIRYHHFLKQRNALLKKFAETGRRDLTLLGSYDEEMIRLSQILAKRRAELMDEVAPMLQAHYAEISQGQEKVTILYETEALREDFASYFQGLRKKDFITKNSNAGIHKDDYNFLIGEHPIRKIGSQGQQKSFIIALKLAQFQIFESAKGEKPLLLLDDIFDKLDDTRIAQMMQLISKHTFGQIFLTDARPERSQAILTELDSEVFFFGVENGQVSH
ncbi:MAG TPA: DNA replication and repair protein RecF [Algoriphagus sp.]|uniref:DNA replication/repair protein RecF n=1 Tax=unclassified Algoriphagus TaxID=2641541 RepID=UPI000C36C82F|nr:MULTISPECIES: DNA replication/repair protein RecF [unclassified Algoriphagus]MAL14611.1 DNA replication and repair protein RecF [Algoriphagus sp.]MAN87632.1 DNA replication and repair protein RecF [Algoriphagus sp.]QYH40654.1 DNA replication/repair protein RecF [Algoriphagus sp. NBT04N3]HAD50934.1 DNA replication and repair protein RecF [Algoriphagus sp.]HAS59961.1 DNA replication and repair protein RecF [Algoriphagus sp.]